MDGIIDDLSVSYAGEQLSKKQSKDLRLLLDVPEDDVIFSFESHASALASVINQE